MRNIIGYDKIIHKVIFFSMKNLIEKMKLTKFYYFFSVFMKILRYLIKLYFLKYGFLISKFSWKKSFINKIIAW